MLNELEIRNVRKLPNGDVEFSCPFPGHNHLDRRPSASMSGSETPVPDKPGKFYPKTTFHCFTCGASGSAIKFLAEYEGVNTIVARRFLKERFAADYTETSKISLVAALNSIFEDKFVTPEPPGPYQIISDEWLDEFGINWPDVFMEWDQTKNSPYPLCYMFDRGFEPET